MYSTVTSMALLFMATPGYDAYGSMFGNVYGRICREICGNIFGIIHDSISDAISLQYVRIAKIAPSCFWSFFSTPPSLPLSPAFVPLNVSCPFVCLRQFVDQSRHAAQKVPKASANTGKRIAFSCLALRRCLVFATLSVDRLASITDGDPRHDSEYTPPQIEYTHLIHPPPPCSRSALLQHLALVSRSPVGGYPGDEGRSQRKSRWLTRDCGGRVPREGRERGAVQSIAFGPTVESTRCNRVILAVP